VLPPTADAAGMTGQDGSFQDPGASGAKGSAEVYQLSSQPGSVPAAAMRLWLSHVQVAWLSEDMETVGATLNLLSSVSPCNDTGKLQECKDIANTITLLAAQLNSGLDYYGNRPNFVPSLSLGALQAYTCNTLLPLMKTLEASIQDYEAASNDQAAREAAAKGAVMDMQNKIASMKSQLVAADDEWKKLDGKRQELMEQRDDLRSQLEVAIAIFEAAINKVGVICAALTCVCVCVCTAKFISICLCLQHAPHPWLV
jgi:hypothetical protein